MVSNSDNDLRDIFGLQNSSLEIPELNPVVFEYVCNDLDKKKQIFIFPLIHNQVQFSNLVPSLIKKIRPTKVAIELPFEIKNLINLAIKRLPFYSIIYENSLNLDNNEIKINPNNISKSYISHPGETLFWTAYHSLREGIEVEYVDTIPIGTIRKINDNLDFNLISIIGWEVFWKNSFQLLQEHLDDNIHLIRSINMFNKIISILEKHDCIFFACGAAHWPIIAYLLNTKNYFFNGSIDPINSVMKKNIALKIKQKGELKTSSTSNSNWKIADIHPHSYYLISKDLPMIIGQMVISNKFDSFNYLNEIRKIYFVAEKNYIRKFDETISPAIFKKIFQYLRNLGRLQFKLIPDLYNILLTAKSMVDGDYAYEVFLTAISYPFIPNENQKLENTIKFSLDEETNEIIKFVFKRRFKRPILKKMIKRSEFDDFDPIPEESFEGEWKDVWDKFSPYGYVSYPPEDIYIEGYMNYLRKRITEIIMEENSSSIKFDTSLEDGIDWRETVAHYKEKEIYVKKYPRNVPKIGALIVQFLEEPFDEDEYNYHSTLFAEHDKESHISMITTTPGEVFIGPGITRLKYAAFISQFPPLGMPYLIPKTNEDLKLRLIFTAMNMSLTNIIGFVAPKPPSAAHRYFASQNGFKIIYFPLSQLSKASFHRLRILHLLAHKDLRDIAKEYIGY